MPERDRGRGVECRRRIVPDRGRGVECRRGIGGEGWSAGEGERGGVPERDRE